MLVLGDVAARFTRILTKTKKISDVANLGRLACLVETPKLDQLFSSRLRSLRLGIAVMVIHGVSVILWLVNYYVEYATYAQLELETGIPNPIIQRGPFSFLWVVSGAVISALLLCGLYFDTRNSFKEYGRRIEIEAISPEFADLHSMVHPLIYSIRNFSRNEAAYLGVVSLVTIYPLLGYSWLFVTTIPYFNMWLSMIESLHPLVRNEVWVFWIKRLVFYGANAVLFWIFLLWSVVSFFRSHETYSRLTKKYEIETVPEEIRKIEKAVEQTMARAGS